MADQTRHWCDRKPRTSASASVPACCCRFASRSSSTPRQPTSYRPCHRVAEDPAGAGRVGDSHSALALAAARRG